MVDEKKPTTSGYGWFSRVAPSSDDDFSSYWTYATDSLHAAAETIASSFQHAPVGPDILSPRLRRRTLKAPDIESLFVNPYNSVRGRYAHESRRSSMTAVRSLLSVVPVVPEEGEDDDSQTIEADDGDFFGSPVHSIVKTSSSNLDENSWHASSISRNSAGQLSPTETASQLTEGSLRALRDLALNEAVELSEALEHWTHRWERPALSWLEAGPTGEYWLIGVLFGCFPNSHSISTFVFWF